MIAGQPLALCLFAATMLSCVTATAAKPVAAALALEATRTAERPCSFLPGLRL